MRAKASSRADLRRPPWPITDLRMCESCKVLPRDGGLHDHRRDDDAEDPESHEAANQAPVHEILRFAYSHAK